MHLNAERFLINYVFGVLVSLRRDSDQSRHLIHTRSKVHVTWQKGEVCVHTRFINTDLDTESNDVDPSLFHGANVYRTAPQICGRILTHKHVGVDLL